MRSCPGHRRAACSAPLVPPPRRQRLRWGGARGAAVGGGARGCQRPRLAPLQCRGASPGATGRSPTRSHPSGCAGEAAAITAPVPVRPGARTGAVRSGCQPETRGYPWIAARRWRGGRAAYCKQRVVPGRGGLLHRRFQHV